MRTPISRKFLPLGLSWAFLLATGGAFAAEWKVKDAPYRAVIRQATPPNDPDAGVLMEIPDFGTFRNDLGDVLLTDASGVPVPVAPVSHVVGQKACFIAKEMKPGADYYLYFGGQVMRALGGWTPRQGLVLETRSLGLKTNVGSLPEMLEVWNACTNRNGVGYVAAIKTAGNPFAPPGAGLAPYASHYTGLLRTSAGEKLTLFTVSSDASFVLADGRPLAEWPGIHGSGADEKHIHQGTVTPSTNAVRIDYYQAKVSPGPGGSLLGVRKERSYKPVPSESWVHPGTSRFDRIDAADGSPVPHATISYNSYIGFGGGWLYDVTFEAPRNAPQDWTPEWRFSDGIVIGGARCERVIPQGAVNAVSLVYRKGEKTVQGIGLVRLQDNLSPASVWNPAHRRHYLKLISEEKPHLLPAPSIEPFLPFLNEFANNDVTGRFSTAWILKTRTPDNPLWTTALLSAIRSSAQTDPKKAYLQLQAVAPEARKQHLKEISMLELELLVFYLHDPLALPVAQRIAHDFPGTPEAQLAQIRVGDYYRLTDQPAKAEVQYASVQKQINDATGGRKLPAMDRSYSITIENLLNQGMRHEAAAKLGEWEKIHPLCKRDSDYLLLEARMLNSFGYWAQALAELDSFKKTHLESPYEINADFFRAESLDGLGRRDEAREIRKKILRNYPKHELADDCRKLLSKP